MESLDKLFVQEHPARALIKKYNIPLKGVARYLDISYGYASKIMSGTVAPSRKIQFKLDELAEQLKKRG